MIMNAENLVGTSNHKLSNSKALESSSILALQKLETRLEIIQAARDKMLLLEKKMHTAPEITPEIKTLVHQAILEVV